jgi:hypothetical protein
MKEKKNPIKKVRAEDLAALVYMIVISRNNPQIKTRHITQMKLMLRSQEKTPW